MLSQTNFLVTAVTAALVAALSAWIAFRLAFRRFRSERWWERKAAAYDRVIEALHEMAEAWDRDLRVAATGRELSEEESDIQAQRYERARREIDRAVVLGAYILGIEAQERLREYQKRTRGGGNEHWVDVVVEASAAANDCLKDVIEIARRDMGADEASKWGRFGGRNLERLGRGD